MDLSIVLLLSIFGCLFAYPCCKLCLSMGRRCAAFWAFMVRLPMSASTRCASNALLTSPSSPLLTLLHAFERMSTGLGAGQRKKLCQRHQTSHLSPLHMQKRATNAGRLVLRRRTCSGMNELRYGILMLIRTDTNAVAACIIPCSILSQRNRQPPPAGQTAQA